MCPEVSLQIHAGVTLTNVEHRGSGNSFSFTNSEAPTQTAVTCLPALSPLTIPPSHPPPDIKPR